ncbi:hypothetical protein GCM10008938_10330 [Deinococcus roseus]|uniref:Uncharacterized protein n=2 Tax=Deinococcus roseus TaxID=392414 RepID=A0ABQ2CW27_9DEIO|nr:hypothetical protein GCM10008938_10330 [Deinococcus roseus]
MAYTLYITGKNHPISEAAWIDFTAQNPEFHPDPLNTINPNTREHLAFSGALAYRQGKAVFVLIRGRIQFRAHDLEISLPVAQHIAAALNAEILGEEGEMYSS